VREHNQSPDGEVQTWDEYSVMQCRGCLTLSFMQESTCTEDVEYDDEGMDTLKVTRTLYPSRLVGRALLEDHYYLPSNVEQIYLEAHAALCSSLPIMAGFGVRAVVEAVCTDKAIPGKNLQARIDGLASSGHITLEGAKILHALRFMGNKAAHEMKAPTAEELGAAFDVVEYLLNGVYIIPRRAKKLTPA
jgi:hypothetical protein